MRSYCGDRLGKAVSQYFFLSCVSDSLLTGNFARAADALLVYSDYCRSALCIKNFPTVSMCNLIPIELRPLRCRKQSDQPCFSGIIENGKEIFMFKILF